ncbi:hypothetical protein PZH43_10930 [Streptococcus gordonii]|nr:hypothetical protein [Streptococcus gordonii]MDE8687849.1 hypothetical protein [Streptococcus gordonii]
MTKQKIFEKIQEQIRQEIYLADQPTQSRIPATDQLDIGIG